MVKNSLEDYFESTLIGGAIGDALGNALEGMTPERISKKYGEVIDYQEMWSPKGAYTDDTELTLCLAESLIDCKGFNLEDLARKFIRWLPKSDSFGIASQSAVVNLIEGKDPKESGIDSPGNGAAMRISPISLVYSGKKKEIEEITRAATYMTHANEDAFAGALAVSLAVDYIMKRRKKFNSREMLKYISEEISKFENSVSRKIGFVLENLDKDIPYMITEIGTSSNVAESVPFAFYCFARNPNDFEDILVSAVNSGGDTDTNASIAGSLGGCYNGLDKIPQRWLKDLKNLEFIREISRKLFNLHKKLK